MNAAHPPISTANVAPEHFVLIIGGSANHLGGVEAFCDRSAVALAARGGWRSERIAASTAYLNFSRLPAFFKGLRQLIGYRKARPDIVWVQYVNLPDLTYVLLARLLGMRVMVTPHLGTFWRSQGNPVLRSISERILRLAHRLALISWTQELEIALPRKVPRSLIRNFLPIEVLEGPFADAASLPAPMQLIHSARLSAEKGTFMVVDVCHGLREAGIAFHCRITGTGAPETMERLHAMVRDYKLGDQLSVLGRVPEDDLLDHLRRSDILVHLSSVDSYPLIVLEAMACSATPVVLELAGARDMVETFGGHIVQPGAPVDQTIDWLKRCDLAELRADRDRAAHEVRTEYAWSRCAAALAQALDACLGVTGAAEPVKPLAPAVKSGKAEKIVEPAE